MIVAEIRYCHQRPVIIDFGKRAAGDFYTRMNRADQGDRVLCGILGLRRFCIGRDNQYTLPFNRRKSFCINGGFHDSDSLIVDLRFENRARQAIRSITINICPINAANFPTS